MVDNNSDGFVPPEVPLEVPQDGTGVAAVVLVEETDRAVEAVEMRVLPEVVTEGPIEFQSSRSIEELMSDGPEDGNVEEEVRLDIHKLREHIFDTDDQLVDIVENARSSYLSEFLRQIRGNPASSESAMINRCKKWIKAPGNQQKYILLSVADLRTKYTQKYGRPWTKSWSAAVLIAKIISDSPLQQVSRRRAPPGGRGGRGRGGRDRGQGRGRGGRIITDQPYIPMGRIQTDDDPEVDQRLPDMFKACKTGWVEQTVKRFVCVTEDEYKTQYLRQKLEATYKHMDKSIAAHLSSRGLEYTDANKLEALCSGTVFQKLADYTTEALVAQNLVGTSAYEMKRFLAHTLLRSRFRMSSERA